MTSRDLSFENIAVGDTASFDRTWTNEDVRAFAALSRDENPLHLDDAYAATTKFGRRVVHGMLLGAACSALVGTYLPGKRCLYLRQDLVFRHPVFIGETTAVRGTVASKSQATRVLTLAITITRDGENVADGTATVQVL